MKSWSAEWQTPTDIITGRHLFCSSLWRLGNLDHAVSASQFAFCCSDKYHDQKQPREKRLHLTAYHTSVREVRVGAQGGNLEAGTEVETVEEYCFLACYHGSISLFSHITQEHLLRGGTDHSGVGLPRSSINNHKKSPI